MRNFTYPLASIEAPAIALGCMHFGGNWRLEEPYDEETFRTAVQAVEAALDSGIHFFDHADIYCSGKSESVFADVMRDLKVDRSAYLLQSKCGIRFKGDPNPESPGRYDFSYEHIVRSCERSLERLKTDYLDVYLLHRPDVLAEPDEIARAFSDLHEAGKVLFFGVSNHTPAQMELLRRALGDAFPLVANQVEINLLKTHLIDAGIVSNGREPATGFHSDGTLEYHRLHGVVTQAWAPMAYGYLSGRTPDKEDPRIVPTAALVAELASKLDVSREAIVLGWLLRHPARIQPIVGTRNPDRIRACAQAASVKLSREDWYRLYLSGRGQSLP